MATKKQHDLMFEFWDWHSRSKHDLDNDDAHIVLAVIMEAREIAACYQEITWIVNGEKCGDTEKFLERTAWADPQD